MRKMFAGLFDEMDPFGKLWLVLGLGSWRNAIRASPFSESASQQQRASASSAQITVHTPQQ